MNTENSNPADSVLNELDQHLRSIKKLLNQLEPTQRLQIVNEMMVKLLSSNSSSGSAQDKLNRKHNTTNMLSKEEELLCKKLSNITVELYRVNQND